MKKRGPPPLCSVQKHAFSSCFNKVGHILFPKILTQKKGIFTDWKKTFIYQNNIGNMYFIPRCLEKIMNRNQPLIFFNLMTNNKKKTKVLSLTHIIVVYVISKSDMKKISKLFNKN
jgi:hypothetical protein